MTGEDVKAFFDAKVSRVVTMYNLNPGIKGAINGILNRACRGSDNRKLVLKYLCGVTSSNSLSAAQWIVLHDMVKPDKGLSTDWHSANPKFQRAIDAVLAALPKQEGQGEMWDDGLDDSIIGSLP